MERRRKSRTAMHWEFYLGLEDDLLRASRYIDFSESNLQTHSQFLSQALISACAEFECVSKSIAEVANLQIPRSITDIKKIFELKNGIALTVQLQTLRGDWNIRPLKRWTENDNLKWWTSYNRIKHHRYEQESDGNLKNALYATAALYIANLALSNTEGSYAISRVRNSPSRLFAVKSINFEGDADHFEGSVISHHDINYSPASLNAFNQSL